MTMRPISTAGLCAPKKSEVAPGGAPELKWIAVADLVVDDAYQRPITRAGQRNIQKIAANFRWACFAPVICARREDGRFAIVDGQHRATAAMLAGVSKIPCLVITAPQAEQAASFAAINGAVTQISRLALHKAALAAGEAEALRIHAVAEAAGVTVMPYPKSELNQQPGETLAIGALALAIRTEGDEVVILALRCVRETKNNLRGGLLAPVITAMCTVVGEVPKSRRKVSTMLAIFDRINIIRELDFARRAEKPKGTAVYTVLAERLRKLVFDGLRGEAA